MYKSDCTNRGLVKEVIETPRTPLKELKASVAEMGETVNRKNVDNKYIKNLRNLLNHRCKATQIPPLATHYTANVLHQQNWRRTLQANIDVLWSIANVNTTSVEEKTPQGSFKAMRTSHTKTWMHYTSTDHWSLYILNSLLTIYCWIYYYWIYAVRCRFIYYKCNSKGCWVRCTNLWTRAM